MSLKFSFETDAPELAKLIREVAENALPSEAAKGVNKTMTFIANETATAISAETGIARNLVKRRIKALKRFRASPKRLTASGFMGEVEFPVGKLTPKPRKAGSGVTYKTVAGQAVNPRAFFAKMPSGRKSAYVRKGGGRLPIKEVKLDISKIMRRHLNRVLNTKAPEYMEKVFFEDMEKRVKRDIIRAGLRSR